MNEDIDKINSDRLTFELLNKLDKYDFNSAFNAWLFMKGDTINKMPYDELFKLFVSELLADKLRSHIRNHIYKNLKPTRLYKLLVSSRYDGGGYFVSDGLAKESQYRSLNRKMYKYKRLYQQYKNANEKLKKVILDFDSDYKF